MVNVAAYTDAHDRHLPEDVLFARRDGESSPGRSSEPSRARRTAGSGGAADALACRTICSTRPPRYLCHRPFRRTDSALAGAGPQSAAANAPGQILSRLKRGAVLQPDGSKKVHSALGEVLLSIGNGLFYDEEVPREGARVTRQRRLARWTDGSTWMWTSFKNEVGQGEGSSQLRFDQIIGPRGATPAE